MKDYTQEDLEAMDEFRSNGAWLIARGTPNDPKQPLHEWAHGGLQSEDQFYDYISNGAEIGLILNTAEMLLVDLDNPSFLTDDEFFALGFRKKPKYHESKVKYGKIKKAEWRQSPKEDKMAVLDWFQKHADQGPPCCSEISESGDGMHWLYRCLDADDFHRNSPCIEIFANKKPVFIKDWASLKGFKDMPKVKFNDIRNHWLPLDRKLDALTPPPPPPSYSPASFINSQTKQFDYHKYLDSKPEAGSGRNCYLFHWVRMATRRQDQQAVNEATCWASGMGLSQHEINATIKSAQKYGGK